MRIGIIGAGHAGVSAASAVAAKGAEVVLFSAEAVPPYFRPRLVEYAFSQIPLDDILMHPRAWYAESGIDLRLETPVLSLDPAAGAVATKNGEEQFDALILSTGAGPFFPPLFKESDGILPLWTLKDAQCIRERISPGETLLIVGGGILGIEAALRAVGMKAKAVIVERADRLMPNQFGKEPAAVLRGILTRKGVRVITSETVISAADVGADGVMMELGGGETLKGCAGLVSIGARCDLSLFRTVGLNVNAGLIVDEHLMTSAPKVFACGDVAQIGIRMHCSAQEAVLQGRIAGANAVASVAGEPLASYEPSIPQVSFKMEDVELLSIGRSQGDAELFIEQLRDAVYKSVITEEGIAVGVQMVGDRKGFQKYMKMVKENAKITQKDL